MTDNLNINDNVNEHTNTPEEHRKDTGGDMLPFCEEITVMKTEIKEEWYDFEMAIDDMEIENVKDECISSPEICFEDVSSKYVKSTEQSLNGNLVSENCQLREEDLKKKKKLSKKGFHLKRNKAEEGNSLKRRVLVEQDGESKKYKYNSLFKCMYKNCECSAGQEAACECNVCEYATARKSALNTHILAKHSAEQKKYKCADCNYATHRRYDLKQHIRTHTNDRPFKCTYKNCECTAGHEAACECNMCEYATAQKCALKTHILLKHSTEPKKYRCADCDYATYRRYDLRQHIRIHTNDRPFKCTYKNCECSTGREAACECNMCEYETAHNSALKTHILLKHSAEAKKYRCAHCNYATHRRQNLELHIRTHTNDRPFKCMHKNCICGAEQEEACECDLCEYAAAQKARLKMHILAKHSKA